MFESNTHLSAGLDGVEEAIEAIRRGELIIVVDDEGRENEGDLIGAADAVTPQMINSVRHERFNLAPRLNSHKRRSVKCTFTMRVCVISIGKAVPAVIPTVERTG